ncbi:MAG: hypothetical protein LBQ94_08205 [Treponema sp.]|jgi:hypothetical protein|nr:hypothetical protein [Treponema sp.]
MNVKRIGLILLLIVLVAVVVFAQSKASGGVIVTLKQSSTGRGSYNYGFELENTTSSLLNVEVKYRVKNSSRDEERSITEALRDKQKKTVLIGQGISRGTVYSIVDVIVTRP